METNIQDFLSKAVEQQDGEALQSAFNMVKDLTSAYDSGQTPNSVLELLVVCAEIALQLQSLKICTLCLKSYFERNPPANYLLCRAYLCQGQIRSPPTSGNVEDFEECVNFFLKAIGIAKSDPKYYFVVFNTSVLYFKAVRTFLLPGRCHFLIPSLRLVVQSLEEVADPDHKWRSELMMHLIKCLVDSGKSKDAADLAKVTEKFIKSHVPDLYPNFFVILVQHSLVKDEELTEISKQDPALAAFYKIEQCKKMEEIKKGQLTQEVNDKLGDIFSHLVGSTQSETTTTGNDNDRKSSTIHTTKRVTLLLELAMLSLQVKQQTVASNCLKELKMVKSVSTGQRIIMKCVKSEISLIKKDTKMNIFTKDSVESRLQEIAKLDHWLKSAVTANEHQAVQAVCATQWKVCLPLLQHGLKRHIKATLLRMVHELENIQSLMLETRCQIHMELAVIEEEDGFLGSSLNHLRKAIQLDNGRQNERLSSALHNLQLRKTPYQTLSRNEDKAAMLLQQARDKPNERKSIRPVLVAVGVLLASDDFQTLLNGENIPQIPASSPESTPMSLLFAKARHYTECFQKVSENLTSQAADIDNTGRMDLWVTLVKTARRNEVWDVCRTACRFCLPYDNEQWKTSKAAKCRCSEDESCLECVNGCLRVRDYLLHLAEVYLISAEATVQKLFTEGFQLNSPPVLPQNTGLQVSIEGPQWIILRDWIQDLSSYATSNFLRAAELGLEIMQPWLVINSAIYLWNYNSHLIMAGDYQTQLSSLQSLLDMLRKVECSKNRILVVLLCNVVARGLTEPLFGPDGSMPNVQAEKGRRVAVRGKKKTAASVNEFYLDAAGMKNANCALELCDYALQVCNSKSPGEVVPISVKKQVVTTWVQIKMMLQQQISPKINVKDDASKQEEISELNVLVEMEKLQCNKKSRHMDFIAHSLSTVVKNMSQCRWTDVVVKLQVWCQLAALGHSEEDQGMVMCCTGNALQLEDTAAKHISSVPSLLYDLSAVHAMLSNAACLRGMSLVQKSKGDLPTYREALKVIFSSVRYAEKAKNPTLCITAARHYWNTCLPLTQRPEERQKLQDPLEKILNAVVQTSSKQTQTQVRVRPTISHLDGGEDLTLKAAIYSLVLRIHIDKTDKGNTLLLLDKAISNLPSTIHTKRLLKHCILLKARMGQGVLMDMQKLREEEQACSLMWRQVALSASTLTQQLTSYQRAIITLVSPEAEWQKVNFVLEFAQWLYYNNFPRAIAQHHIEWALDILLQPEKAVDGTQAEEAEDPKSRRLNSMVSKPLIGVLSLSLRTDMATLKEVQRLDYLVQAHTLLAFMADRSSPEYQLHLLRAYTFVIQIWLVSMTEVSDMLKPPPTAGSKKGQKPKVQKRGKGKTAEDRLDQALPLSPDEWARYICPSQARIIFKANKNQQCINMYTISNQLQSVFYLTLLGKQLNSISLNHLTLPVLHLAEIIAHDLLNEKSLSDLLRIKIFQTCCQLGLEKCCPYQKRVLDLLTNNEQEQIRSHRRVALSKEKGMNQKASNQKEEPDESSGRGKQRRELCFQNIYLEKAEVCLSMELLQPARQLLVEAHSMAKDLGDPKALAKCLLSLATLACKEQNHAQALILLDQAQALGGGEEFWYHFTLTKVSAVLGQRHEDAKNRVQKILNQGCEALKTVQEKQLNRVKEVQYLITRLEIRSIKESMTAITDGECGMDLCDENVQKLKAASEGLKNCAGSFTELGYIELAAETHADYAQCIRILAEKTADKEEKQNLLLHAFAQMQLAVLMLEQLVLNAQKLLPPKEETCGISLETAWRLLYLRLGLVEFCLVLMEDHCAEATVRALAREKMTPIEIALEDFTASSPEPDSMKHKWINVGKTLDQLVLGQLATISFHPLHNIETQARCLNLMGKYLRLQALLKDPIHLNAIWRQTTVTEFSSDSETVSAVSEPSDKDRDSSQTESVKPTKECPEVKKRRRKANQILSQAAMAISETINLCLEHNLPSFILADASINMLACVGQPDPEAAGQYLALFQSCCSVTTILKALCSTCVDTCGSQLAALLSLHSKLLNSRDVTCGMLEGLKDSLKKLSNACSHLIVNPNHFNLLSDLPSNLKILLLQHSENHLELYGAFYEMAKATDMKKVKTAKAGNTISCSKVAKVSVCSQHLVALREQIKVFGHEARHTLFKEVCLQGTEEKHETSEELHTSAVNEKLAPLYCRIVQEMEDYLYPLLSQMDFPCFKALTTSEPNPEITPHKEKKEKQSSTKSRKPEFLVVLADSTLLDLPLESLPIFQQGNFSSVSRDFSLQLLHSRLRSAKAEKARDKKEGKGGKGGGNKKPESIKSVPSYAIPVEIRNLKYIVDTGSGLSATIVEILDAYGKISKQKCEGYMSGQQTPSLSDIEQLLSKCSAFIYIGREQLMANVPPAKLVLGRLSRCQMALLFEQVYGNAGTFRQAMEDMDKSKEQSPLETALLLSVSGASCVILNQWQSSLHDNTNNMTTVVQNFLKSDQTSSQIIHALRKRNILVIPKAKDAGSQESECLSGTKDEDNYIKMNFSLSDVNCIVYGLPNLILV